MTTYENQDPPRVDFETINPALLSRRCAGFNRKIMHHEYT